MPLELSDLSLPAKGTTVDERAWEEFFNTYGKNCNAFSMVRYTNSKGESKCAFAYGFQTGAPMPPLREQLIHQLKLENVIH